MFIRTGVAVVAIPDEKWGETPLGLVVRVELRESLPRNALGKVLKRELRAAYW
jgi:acyl-CoA synthetase (AMP-forming)/AMP-acid ligase II